MCIGLEGKVVSVDGEHVVVDTPTGQRELRSLNPVEAGDTVLFSFGLVVRKVDE